MTISYKILLFIALFITSVTNAQEKLKGNRIVTTENREISEFNKIEVIDNIEVQLLYGTTPEISIKTDSNLQEAINTEVKNGILIINTSSKIIRKKELLVTIKVTKNLKEISAYNNAKIKAPNVLNIDSLTINAFDNTDFSLKLNSKIITINGKKNSDLNLDVISDSLIVNAIENSTVKGKVNTKKTAILLSEKSDISFSGTSENLELKAIGNGHFIGKELVCKNSTVKALNNTDVFVNSTDTIDVSATNSSEVYIYSTPKITITEFLDKASIHKKEL